MPSNKGGRKSKYCPEIVQDICDAIALSGRDEDGWKAGKIHLDTFYDWQKKFPEFSEAVEAAKSEYRKTCPPVLTRQAQRAFSDYLHGNMTRVIHTKEEFEYFGDPPPHCPSIRQTTRTIPVGIPKWAIERVLGTRMEELDAIKTLVEAGWLPRWIIQVTIDEIDSVKKVLRDVFTGILPDGDTGRIRAGLSDTAADAIRRQILGYESQDPAALPDSLEPRRITDQSSGEVPTGGVELGR